MGSPCVLVVDDDHTIRGLLTCFLKSSMLNQKLHILEASNGKEAIETLKTTPVDIMITDYDMPHMNGAELSDHVRNTYPATKIVMMSGYVSEPELPPGLRLDDFLRKPFQLETMLTTMNNILAEQFPSQGDGFGPSM